MNKLIVLTASMDMLNKLQLLQNVARRTLLLANKHEHVSDLALYTLSGRREFHLLTLCHKMCIVNAKLVSVNISRS